MVDAGGAALGAAFGEVLEAIRHGVYKGCLFKSILGQLKGTLEGVTTTMEKIEKLNEVLDLPKHETQDLIKKLEKGNKLVLKCRKVRWNFFKRIYYAYALERLDASITKFCQVNLQTQLVRDVRENLELQRDTNALVRRFASVGTVSKSFSLVKIGQPCSVPDPPEETLGFDAPLKELKMDLLNKAGEQVILVSAPGGSGKTTLVSKLCKDYQVKDQFKDNIFFVTVSQSPDVKVIVRNVLEHKNCDVPKFEKDEVAINCLKKVLKEIGQPILLILDDVWTGSETMVEMFKCQLDHYKILVTSRSVFPRFACRHILKPLDDKAARALFNSSAYLPNGDSNGPNDELVNKILKACKGSPLVLKLVGGALRGQLVTLWESIVEGWTQDSTIFNSDKFLYDCLKTSFDVLDCEIKECYMDLGSFPEDQRIPVTALIDMWTELCRLVRDHNPMNNLFYLYNRYLVDLVVTRKNASDDGFYNDHFVKQHDLLRELIIHESRSQPIERMKRLFIDIRQDKFPEWWSEQKQQPLTARLISISTDQYFSSRWYNIQAPKVEVVVLNIQSTKYTLPNFLKEMDQLKVLIITNYGFFPSELSNFELLGSLPNLKRVRLEQVTIPSFDMAKIRMENLHKISFFMCNVGQVFRNSTFQVSYAFPNLEELDIDYCNDLVELPNELGEIVSLKTISVTNCHKLSRLPGGIGQLVNVQKLRLASCTDLEELPSTVTNLSNLKFLDISECLSIKELPRQIGELSSLETLCMRGCSSCKLYRLNLKNLKVVICDEETAINWERFQPDLSKEKMKVVKEDINLNWLSNDNF